MPANSVSRYCPDPPPSLCLCCSTLLYHFPPALSRSSLLHCPWGFQFTAWFSVVEESSLSACPFHFHSCSLFQTATIFSCASLHSSLKITLVPCDSLCNLPCFAHIHNGRPDITSKGGYTCNVTAYHNTISWQCGRDSWPRNVSKVGYVVTLRAFSVCCRYLAVASEGRYGYGLSRCGRATWRCTSTPAQAISSIWCDSQIPTAHQKSP